jgi:hypothetical protein
MKAATPGRRRGIHHDRPRFRCGSLKLMTILLSGGKGKSTRAKPGAKRKT